MTLKSIYIRNFRIFGDEGSLIKLSPITFLTGCNSAGKSSLAKAMLLLDAYLASVRANDYNLIDTPLDFTKVVKLGNFDAVLNKESRDKGVEEIVLGYTWNATSFVGEIQAYFTFVKKDSDLLNLGWLNRLSICVDSKELLTIEIVSGEYRLQITDIPTFIEYYRYHSVANYAVILRHESSKDEEERARDQAINQAYNISILPGSKEATELLDLEKTLIKSGRLHSFPKVDRHIDTCAYDYFKIVKGAIGFGELEKLIYDLEVNTNRKLETSDIDTIKRLSFSSYLCQVKSYYLKYHPDAENSLVKVWKETFWPSEEQTMLSYIHSEAVSIIEYVQKNDSLSIKRHLDFINREGSYYSKSKEKNILTFLQNGVRGCSTFLIKIFAKTLTPRYCSRFGYVDASTVDVKRLYPLDMSDRFGSLVDRYNKLAVPSNHIDGTYQPGDFIKKWLFEFGVCDDILIDNLEGSARIRLVSKEMPGGRLLADYGYGVTQLIALFIHIEIAINHIKASEYLCGDEYGIYSETIPYLMILEEPEVHLHPRLQSKLADMFQDASSHNIQFIIETHSEYLIRRSQVKVAEMEIEESCLEEKNPFRVYYFPEDNPPYDMTYKTNGHFEEAFGKGFFDEAGKWTRELIRRNNS